MTVHLSVPLDEEQKARLDAIAEARHETTAELATRALTEYLEFEAAFVAAVEEGRADARAGYVYDFADVASDLRRRTAEDSDTAE